MQILTLDEFERQKNYMGKYHTSLDINASNIVCENGKIVKGKSYREVAYSQTPNKTGKRYINFNSTDDIAKKIGLNWTIPAPIKKKMTRSEKRRLGLI